MRERKGLRVKNHGGASDPFELTLGHHDSEDPKRVEKGWVGLDDDAPQNTPNRCLGEKKAQA